MKPRVNGLTVQQQMYVFIRPLETSLTANGLAECLGISYGAAAERLETGVAAGWLSKHRVRVGRCWTLFYAVVPGRRPKPDGRGRQPGSRLGGWKGNAISLANLKNNARFPRPFEKRLHPLERAWKMP